MSDEKPKKKRFGCLKIFLYFFLAMVCLIVVWLAFNYRPIAGPGQPMVTVSADTTRIIEPLDDNGDVDFLKAVNLRLSEGVTNENNAFVKLIEALGPLTPPDSPAISDAVMKRLGMDPLPQDGQYLQTFESWFTDKVSKINEENSARYFKKLDEGMDLDTDDGYGESTELSDEDYPADVTVPDNYKMQFQFASHHPWSAEELPEVEKWRLANEPALKIAREGIKRSHYYYPLVAPRSPKMLNANLGYSQQFSKVGDALAVNAMNLLDKDDVDGCIEEIKTIYRLAMHVSQGQSLVEELVCHRITNTGLESLASLCASEKANPAQLQNLLQWVEALKHVDDAGVRVDQLERYCGLDAAVSMVRGGDSSDHSTSELGGQIGMFSGFVDFEETLKQLNAYYDRFAEVGNIKDRSEQEAAWTSLQDDMVENQNWIMGNGLKSGLLGRKSKGIWIGRMLSDLLMPSIQHVVEAENDYKAKHEMLKVVIAAALFKKETGAYPTSIAELAPKYLDTIPADPLTDQPYVWSQTEDGIQIHSPLWNDPQIGVSQNNRIEISARKLTWEQFNEELEEENEDQYESFDFDQPFTDEEVD